MNRYDCMKMVPSHSLTPYIYQMDYLPISAVSNIFVATIYFLLTLHSSVAIYEKEFQAGQYFKTWIRNKRTVFIMNVITEHRSGRLWQVLSYLEHH